MQRRAHAQMQGGQPPQRVAPAQLADQPGVQGNEHGAGQAAQKGHGDDGAAEIAGEAARDHGKHRRVQGGRHAHAQANPDSVEPAQAGHKTVQHQADGQKQGSQCHDLALMAAVDQVADWQGQQTLGQQGQAEG